MGTGSADSGQNMVGTNVYQVKMSYPARQLDGLLTYMLDVGLDIDVPNGILVTVLNACTGKTPEHLGPYVGRFNSYMQKRGHAYRLVVGASNKTYRLVTIT